MNWDTGTVVFGCAAIATFVAAFHVSGLVGRVQTAIGTTNHAVATMGQSDLPDLEKEKLVQQAALTLLRQFVHIVLAIGLILLPPAIVVWGGDFAGYATVDDVWAFLLSWPVIIGSTLVFVAAYWRLRR